MVQAKCHDGLESEVEEGVFLFPLLNLSSFPAPPRRIMLKNLIPELLDDLVYLVLDYVPGRGAPAAVE
jgi:hypothetical protein